MQYIRQRGEINPTSAMTFGRGLTSLKPDCKSPAVITVSSTCSVICGGLGLSLGVCGILGTGGGGLGLQDESGDMP